MSTATAKSTDTVAPAAAPDAVEALLAAVREGRTGEVPVLLTALGPAERRSCLPALKELRRTSRGDWSKEANRRMGALLVAGAGCHPGPAGAATWIGARDFTGRSWARHPALADVVEAQPVEWQTEVVARLAAKRGSGWSWDLYPLIERVVRRTGCTVPASDDFVTEWLRSAAGADRGPRGTATTLLERLRTDTFTPVMLPRLFELDDVSWPLDNTYTTRSGDNWPAAIAGLAESGHFGREELIDLCLARLVRGGKTADQRSFLAVLTAFAPTPQEYAARVRDLLVLLDGPSALAGHAQQVLTGLDEAGLIETEAVVEASAVVLFRSEKKLVRAQLSWLEQAAKRTPERSGPAVLAAAGAFGHPDSALQERALNLVARRLKAAGEAVLPELRLAAEALNPAHHARAGELFGAPVGGAAEDDDTAWAELLPPVPVPAPLGEPLAGPVEVAEELAVLLAGGRPDVAVFERVLDGLVRHAHRDRTALARALEPVLRVNQWQDVGRWRDCGPGDVLYLAVVVAGKADPHRPGSVFRHKGRNPLRGTHNTEYGNALAARIGEAAERVTTAAPPYLLATPTDTTGAIAATVLVERLAGYETAGVTPGPADLSAALLRTAPTADPSVRAAADRLTSAAGRWVAAWLCDGGLPVQVSERVLFAPGAGYERKRRYWDRWWEELRRIVVTQRGSAGPAGPARERLAAEFRVLLEGTTPSVARVRRADEWLREPTVHWAAMLPHHREELAARWLDRFADCADRDRRGTAGMLVVLAEAGGPAGLALHLALGYGLGARHPEDRAAAVDALLVLAARGDLDGALLGRELGELVTLGTVKPVRLAQALTAAADTGAHATVWSVLAAALPSLLAGEAPRGAADLLALAADTARRSAARGPIPEVTATAARPGTSRLVKESRTLRDLLATP
ncbi:DUF6493 family protein [Kitasatospora sp. NPDC058032]|uniref:DUF7824 domain-containing protein n=1 Tax=Kitasatospora sp. NPDC058032 TaxID=3346307 RepID=UPI0036D9B58D